MHFDEDEAKAMPVVVGAWMYATPAARSRLNAYRIRVSGERGGADVFWCEDLEFCLGDDEWLEAIMLYRLGG